MPLFHIHFLPIGELELFFCGLDHCGRRLLRYVKLTRAWTSAEKAGSLFVELFLKVNPE